MSPAAPLIFFTILAPAAGLMAFFAGKGFAGLGGAAGLLALLLLLVRRQMLPALTLPSSRLLLAWIAAGLLSAFWSIDARNSLETMQGLTALLVAALCLLSLAQLIDLPADERWQRRLACGLIGGFLILSLLLLVDQATRGGVYAVTIGALKRRNDWIANINIRAGVLVTLLLWPAMLAAWWLTAKRFWLPALLYLIGGIAAYVSPQVTAKLAFAAGSAAGLFIWLGRRNAALLLGGLVALVMLLTPFVLGRLFSAEAAIESYPSLHYSAKHRLHVWDFVAERYLERPWLGWGIDAARLLPGGDAELASGGEQVPSHPHNGILQFWLELGLLGGALLLAGQWLIWRAIAAPHWTPSARAAAAAAFITALCYFLASFNTWHSWWIGLLAVSFSLLIVAMRSFGRSAAYGGVSLGCFSSS